MTVKHDSWIQSVCPSPKRHLAQLIVRLGLMTGLDIGCGESSPLTALREYGLHSIGVDASPERVESAKRRGLHDDYFCADIREFPLQSLPPIDVIVISHVIEHLTREEGFNLLQMVERFAQRLVYVETPRGFVEPHYDHGDSLDRHRSGWFPWDFESRGYTVFGNGIAALRTAHGCTSVLPEPIARSVERLAQWFVFRRPAWSSTIAAIRYQDQEGNIRRL